MTTEASNNREENYQQQFAGLVMMLATSAMQCMGKLVDPRTRQAQIDLDGAQATIDMLEMLQARTRGNLSPGEDRMLRESIASLQLTFVEMTGAAGAAPAESPAPGPETETASEDAAPPPLAPGDADSAAAASARKQPRFHKSY